jgi:hypothetical protein
MSVKFYALCSKNLLAAQRHERTIPKEDLHIVINTLDDEFANAAVEYCISANIEYSVTESDGTAATGKNTVFDVFKASTNDHMVLVDGDDFITPHGVWLYKQLAASNTCPDVVALEYQYGIFADRGYSNPHLFDPYVGCSDKNNHDQIQGFGCRVFLQPLSYWNRALNGTLIDIPSTVDPNYSYAVHLNNVHTRWANYAYRYINNWETHCRIVFYSKAAAEFRFDIDHIIGEDTLQYFLLKNEHHHGRLTMKTLIDRYPTYVYDTRVGGVCADEHYRVGQSGWIDWLEPLTDKYEEYDNLGLMHDFKLPEIKICYMPWDDPTLDGWDILWDTDYYEPDLMNLVNYPGPNVIWWDALAGAPIGHGKGNNHHIVRA